MVFRERIFPIWTRMTKVTRRAKRLNSDRGRLMLTGMIICGVVGLDTDLSFAYQLFALIACIFITARISLRFQKPDVSIKRHLPRYATAGEPFKYVINVTNEGQRVERDLEIIDNPRAVQPGFEQFKRSREPGEETRNAYDRWIGFHRFIWLQRLNTGITIARSKVPDVGIRDHSNVIAHATPMRRGIVQFESTTVLHPDPFSLNYGVINFESPDQLMILPRVYPVSMTKNFTGKRELQPHRVEFSWSIGESEEFVSLRDYQTGDAINKIHWPSSARLLSPVVKEYQDESFIRQMLVVDTFVSDPTIFEEVINVAASLLMADQKGLGLMDLCFMSKQVEVIPAGPGRGSKTKQLESLAVAKDSTISPEPLLHFLKEKVSSISSCLLVFGGMDPIKLKFIEDLEHLGVPTNVFVIVMTGDLESIREDFHMLEIGRIKESLETL